MSTKLYKIRRIIDGLYSSGGQYVHWTKKGKTWIGSGPLKNHLGQFITGRSRSYGDTEGYEVVEFVVTETETNVFTLQSIIDEKESNRLKADLKEQERARKRKDKLELELLKSLKAKFE